MRFIRLILLIAITGYVAISLINTHGQIEVTVCAATSTCSTPNTVQKYNIAVHWPPGSEVNVYIDPKFSSEEQKSIQAAANAWQSVGAFSKVTFVTADPGSPSGNNTIRIAQGVSSIGYVADGAPNYAGGPGTDPTVIVGGNITFDPTYQAKMEIPNPTPQNPNGSVIYQYKAYSPGQMNGGNVFLTNIMEHEIGHVLGLGDNLDSQGKEIDYPEDTAMGSVAGTNNQGLAPGTYQGVYTSGVEPGHGAGVTDCDKAVVLANQAPPDLSGSGNPSDKGGTTVPQDETPPGDGGSGGGGSNPCTASGGGTSEYDPSCGCIHTYVNCS